METSAFAPGRVNLIGDHTDTTGGFCLPMAVDRGITVSGTRGGDRVRLTTDLEDAADVDIALPITDPHTVDPPWGRFAAAVAAEVSPTVGLVGAVRSTLPAAAGMSSSAALELALALALGFQGSVVDLACAGQRAEHAATGVPCGVLDQFAIAAAVDGHALLLDTGALDATPVPMPDAVEVRVVHSGVRRSLSETPYAVRVDECRTAERTTGPLRSATSGDVASIADPTLRARARHVVSENERTVAAAAALRDGDLDLLGELLAASHRSLRDDFACSHPTVDTLVGRLSATDGVLGARMTGGGWGGCVVAVCRPGTLDDGWLVRPSGGARVTAPGSDA